MDFTLITWWKNSWSKQSSHGRATSRGRASLEMSLTLIRIFMSCNYNRQGICPIRGAGFSADPMKVLCTVSRSSTHHILVLFVGEVKHRHCRFKLVQDLVVSGHVSSQNTSENKVKSKLSLTDLSYAHYSTGHSG